MTRDEEIDAVITAIPKAAQFSADDLVQTRRLMLACQAAIADDDVPGPGVYEIAALLASLSNGFSCWLDTVQTALLNTKISDKVDQAALFGCLKMARVYLAEIDRAREQDETAPVGGTA